MQVLIVIGPDNLSVSHKNNPRAIRACIIAECFLCGTGIHLEIKEPGRVLKITESLITPFPGVLG